MFNPKSSSYYRSLTRNIILIMVSVSVIPLILITLTIRHFSITSFQGNILDHLKLLSQRHKENIDRFLSQQFSNIAMLKDCHGFQEIANDDFFGT